MLYSLFLGGCLVWCVRYFIHWTKNIPIKITADKYEFPSNVFISEEAKDFIKEILVINSSKYEEAIPYINLSFRCKKDKNIKVYNEEEFRKLVIK